MSISYNKLLMLSSLLAIVLWPFAFASAANVTAARRTNINLAVASNFYGTPPSNNAITDLITAFEAANPTYMVTVVDNGATSTLEQNIINGNTKSGSIPGRRHGHSVRFTY